MVKIEFNESEDFLKALDWIYHGHTPIMGEFSPFCPELNHLPTIKEVIFDKDGTPMLWTEELRVK